MAIDMSIVFQPRVGFYRGQPVFVLAIQEGVTRLGIVQPSRHDLRTLAEAMGLGTIDRYLTNLRRAAGSQLVLTEKAAYIETDINALLTSSTSYDSDWGRAVLRDHRCVLLVIHGSSIPGDDVESLIRKAASSRRCVGAAVGVLDATAGFQRGEQRYRLVGTALEPVAVPSTGTSFVLDSNVVLDLEAAATGRLQADSPAFSAVVELMTGLIHQQIVPGFGIAELTWRYAINTYDEKRRASLLAAVDAWFDYGMRGVLDVSDLPERWRRHYRDRIVPRRDTPKDPSFLLLAVYSGLLKLDELWGKVQGYRAKQRIELFVEFCRFISEDLRVVSAHALNIAFDLLVGDPNDNRYVFELLKFGKTHPIRAIRGAAWDVFLLFLPELATGPDNPLDLPPGNRAVLVTADHAIPKLRERIVLRGYIDTGTTVRGLMASVGNLDPRLEVHRPTIEGVFESVQAGIRWRAGHAFADADAGRLKYWTALLEENLRRQSTSSRRFA